MKISELITRFNYFTRANDWRISFVPFIIGCVYLWLYLFNIHFSAEAVILFVLSLTTTFGFASFGYLVNEFFDIDADRLAGKTNKLSSLKRLQVLFLFALSLSITLLPWIWLPADNISFLLIAIELCLFFLYSLPFPRFKNVVFLSGIIDSLYAYVIPLLLSYYTYLLFSSQQSHLFIWFFIVSVFIIGYRNILVHQTNDVLKDMMSGIVTLPQKIGVNRTALLIIVLLLNEVFFFLLFSLIIAFEKPIFFVLTIFYFLFILFRLFQDKFRFRLQYVALDPIRHITDAAYQIWLPLFMLFLLVTMDCYWIVIGAIHFLILVPAFVFSEAVKHFIFIIAKTQVLIYIPTKHLLSLSVNYPIYYFFRLLGVDLKKENKSAVAHIKKLFSK